MRDEKRNYPCVTQSKINRAFSTIVGVLYPHTIAWRKENAITRKQRSLKQERIETNRDGVEQQRMRKCSKSDDQVRVWTFLPRPRLFRSCRHIEVAGVKKADVTESVVTKVRIGRNMKSKRKDVREYNAASGRKK